MIGHQLQPDEKFGVHPPCGPLNPGWSAPIHIATNICVIFCIEPDQPKTFPHWSGTFLAFGSWTPASTPRMSPLLTPTQINQ